MKRSFLNILILLSFNPLFSQIQVKFQSTDDLVITADYYPSGNTKDRYVLMFHQGGSSRAEYREIAPKLKNLQYNCLAVDLRVGDELNFVQNETAKRAEAKGLSQNYIDARADIEKAIEYAYNKTNKRVILMGSSYSASLCLLVARFNPKVQGVIAFSPGEFFRPDIILTKHLKIFDKPTFIACSQREQDFAKQITVGLTPENKTIFVPSDGKCPHGAKALWASNPNSREIWLALTMFFNQLKKDPFF